VRIHVAEAGHYVATGGVDDAHAARIDFRGWTERTDDASVEHERVIGELALGVERQDRDVRERESAGLAPRKLERQELR
jgi:hypothetical protein